MYYGQLQSHKIYLFKQSSYGGVSHIIADATDFIEAFQTNNLTDLRIDTYCGKNLKYGSTSMVSVRTGGVRNACEDCFVQWSGSEEWDEINARERARGSEAFRNSDLPF